MKGKSGRRDFRPKKQRKESGSNRIMFPIQRTITFLVGVFCLWVVAMFWESDSSNLLATILMIAFAVFGAYALIASLIPYKRHTQDIANEFLGQVFIELPIRILVRLLGRLAD